jgi:hypothetical protein
MLCWNVIQGIQPVMEKCVGPATMRRTTRINVDLKMNSEMRRS